jgi:hypothetical protein
MNRPWSPEEIRIASEAWLGDGEFKSCLKFLDNRTYAAAATYMKKRLGLGPRKHSSRGVPAYAWETIKAELANGPATAPELVKKTGLSVSAVCDELRLSKPGRRGKTHIVDWNRRPTGGAPVAVYALGKGHNAPKPGPYTREEKLEVGKIRRRVNRTCLVSKAVNPFASAAGLVAAPTGQTGRVFHHLWDDHDQPEAA